jgi:hypothetical protein
MTTTNSIMLMWIAPLVDWASGGSGGPHYVEPELEFMAVGAASCKACIACACELRIARDYVADLHFPFVIGVCE